MRLRTVALVFALVAPASAFAQQSNAPRPRLGDTVTTASGLRYLFVKHGGGPRPQTGDVMSIHGIGLFTDGKEFWNTRTDSSLWVYRFGVDRIIRGTEEGLREVREGDRIIMILKPELAYGGARQPPIKHSSKHNACFRLRSDERKAAHSRAVAIAAYSYHDRDAVRQHRSGPRLGTCARNSDEFPALHRCETLRQRNVLPSCKNGQSAQRFGENSGCAGRNGA